MASDFVKIGTATLREDMIVRNSYETACWFSDVELKAGTVTDVRTNGYWIVYGGAEGVCVAANFPSGLGGMYYPNAQDAKRIGRIERAQGRQTNISFDIREHADWDFDLLPGVEWKQIGTYDHYDPPRPMVTLHFEGERVSEYNDAKSALREAAKVSYAAA